MHERFNGRAVLRHDEAARSAGSLLAEDRFGVKRVHPLTTLGIGAVEVAGTDNLPRAEVANAAAAKRAAKASVGGLHVGRLRR